VTLKFLKITDFQPNFLIKYEFLNRIEAINFWISDWLDLENRGKFSRAYKMAFSCPSFIKVLANFFEK